MAVRLSYIVATDGWATIEELVDCLRRQTVADEVELVVLAPAGLEPPDVSPLAGVRHVATFEHGGAARAAGVRAAGGDLVAIGETHVLPHPGWAATVIGAHDAGADVVLPQMENANPSRLTEAGFAMDYGRYANPDGSSRPVPMFNATFRRDVLLSFDPLEPLLEPSLRLDSGLRARSAQIVHQPGARIAHLNVDRLKPWLHERFLVGMLFGNERSKGWSVPRRAIWVAASPLIAVVLFARSQGLCRRASGWSSLPLLAVACALWAGGEAVGYAGVVTERHATRMSDYETRKRDYVGAA